MISVMMMFILLVDYNSSCLCTTFFYKKKCVNISYPLIWTHLMYWHPLYSIRKLFLMCFIIEEQAYRYQLWYGEKIARSRVFFAFIFIFGSLGEKKRGEKNGKFTTTTTMMMMRWSNFYQWSPHLSRRHAMNCSFYLS